MWLVDSISTEQRGVAAVGVGQVNTRRGADVQRLGVEHRHFMVKLPRAALGGRLDDAELDSGGESLILSSYLSKSG